MGAEAETWRSEGLFAQWTPWTFIPVLTQGLIGIVIGIITKIAGGVKKTLATCCGLVLSCVVQQVIQGEALPFRVLVAVPLAVGGVYLHATNPPTKKKAS